MYLAEAAAGLKLPLVKAATGLQPFFAQAAAGLRLLSVLPVDLMYMQYLYTYVHVILHQ